jgi:8-oxo-dGTP pyrophosphatase MutT (NUDIX family)
VRVQLDWFNDKLAARLAELAAGRITPAVPRDAATVIVLRSALDDGGTPRVETLMLRRTAAMKFGPGAYVFPGGSVDPADYGADIGWHGPSAADFGVRLGASAEVARALVCAAVREMFEEAGVLLAGPGGGGPVAETSGPSWEADRQALTSGELTLAELLNRRGLVLRADLLVPWARWITPDGEPRRFDARFFAAALPPGQQVSGHAAETDHLTWLSPADALGAARAGEMSLFPPTAVTLNDFASAAAAGDDLTAMLARPRTIEPVQPQLVLADGEAWLELPDEVEYPL